VRALDSSFRTRAFHRADEAAFKVKFNPVTWQQFLAELYEGWLDAVRARLTLMTDALYEFVDAGTKPGSHPTLMSEAIKAGRVVASVEVNRAAVRRLRLCHRVAQISRNAWRTVPPSDRIQVPRRRINAPFVAR
jgi:hypothetical protein